MARSDKPYNGGNNVDSIIISQNEHIINLSTTSLLATLEILNISQHSLNLTKQIHDINAQILKNDIERLQIDKDNQALTKQLIELLKQIGGDRNIQKE